MKVCLYLEYKDFLRGIMFKNIGTGLLSSYKNQKAVLKILNIPFTDKWDDSCDLLQINTPWLKSISLMKKAKTKNKKVAVWAHVTVEDAMQVFRFVPMVAPLLKKYLTYAYNLADIIFCPSEYTKSLLISYGINRDKLIVLSNGVDTSKYFKEEKKRLEYRQKYNLENLTIGTVGLVIPRKGIDTFLEVAQKLPQNRFMWFGKIYISLMVKSLPKIIPHNVTFTGYVDDIVASMNTLDIFIFPSYEENQGMAILEAASLGLPIVVRDIPVYETWLHDEENCLKAKTSADFCKQIQRLLEDKGLREKLSKGSKKLSQDERLETIASKVRIIYSNLTENSVEI